MSRYRPLRRPSKLVVLGGNARDCRSESEEDSNRRQSYSKDVAASMDVATSSSPSSVATSRGPPTALSAAPIKPPSPLPSHTPALAGSDGRDAAQDDGVLERTALSRIRSFALSMSVQCTPPAAVFSPVRPRHATIHAVADGIVGCCGLANRIVCHCSRLRIRYIRDRASMAPSMDPSSFDMSSWHPSQSPPTPFLPCTTAMRSTRHYTGGGVVFSFSLPSIIAVHSWVHTQETAKRALFTGRL
ncbi:hypothetical protein BJ912DRAFT_1141026 [Pholiota molesta]|nr:hypothetical protein BJ912DRAFT_1141026 [Pholiota molesta]